MPLKVILYIYIYTLYAIKSDLIYIYTLYAIKSDLIYIYTLYAIKSDLIYIYTLYASDLFRGGLIFMDWILTLKVANIKPLRNISIWFS